MLGCRWPGLLLAVWSPRAGADGRALAGAWSVLAGVVDTDLASWLLWSGSPAKNKETDTDTLEDTADIGPLEAAENTLSAPTLP